MCISMVYILKIMSMNIPELFGSKGCGLCRLSVLVLSIHYQHELDVIRGKFKIQSTQACIPQGCGEKNKLRGLEQIMQFIYFALTSRSFACPA